MNRWVNVISQVVLGFGSLFNMVEPTLSPRHKLWVQFGIALAQLVVSAIASNYNPDGTPASVSYNPKLEKDRATVLKMLEEQKKRNAG